MQKFWVERAVVTRMTSPLGLLCIPVSPTTHGDSRGRWVLNASTENTAGHYGFWYWCHDNEYEWTSSRVCAGTGEVWSWKIPIRQLKLEAFKMHTYLLPGATWLQGCPGMEKKILSRACIPESLSLLGLPYLWSEMISNFYVLISNHILISSRTMYAHTLSTCEKIQMSEHWCRMVQDVWMKTGK